MSRGLRRAIALSLLGALLVGLPVLLLSLNRYPLYAATTQVRVLADPQIGDEAAVGGEGDEADNFIDTELVTLNSDALRDAVRQRQDDPELTVSAVRVGTSNVVELTTRSSRRDVDESNALVLSRYVEGRRQELQQRILSIGGEVDRQLAVARAAILALQGDESITGELQRAALTTELTRLFQQRNTLQLASDASERLIQPVGASSEGVEQVVDPVRNGALGALAGAVLGLGAGLARDRLRPRVRALEDLMELTPDAALPPLRRLRGRDLADEAGTAASSYVSALTTRDSAFGRPPLVVVGPTSGCGATFVAVGLAIASSRRQPTVLVAAGDALDGRAAEMLGVDLTALTAEPPARPVETVPTRFPDLTYVSVVRPGTPRAAELLEARAAGDLLASPSLEGRAVVVDAPPLDSSAAALELARQSGRVLLVAGVERTSSVELEVAARALRRVGAVLSGVVLDDARHRRRLGPFRSSR